MKPTSLNELTISIATSHVLADCNNGNWLDGYKALVEAGDNDVPDGITVFVDYECHSASHVVSVIDDLQRLILDSSKELSEIAKKSIVQKTIDGTLDSDMTNLDFCELVTEGLQLPTNTNS